MDQEIKIQAEVISEETCQFTLDRPVFPGGSIYFGNKESANGSPLAEQLFTIENIVSLLVSENVVKVTKSGSDECT